MKSTLLTFIIFISVITYGNGQVTFGVHNGYSDYIGLYQEFSIETKLYKKFTHVSRISYAINRGTMFRSGIRYSLPLSDKMNIRIGFDFGGLLERDISRSGFKQSHFMTGGNIGCNYRINKNWGILAEFGYMHLYRENNRRSAVYPQIGVTYSLQ
jgi:hypothetical protein